MNIFAFDNCTNDLLAHCAAIRFLKGKDYTDGNDRLSNFKQAAQRLQITPNLVWAVYFGKHIDAIFSHVRNGQVESEPIKDRIADAINYLLLYWAICVEAEAPDTADTADTAVPDDRQAWLFPPDTFNA